ncbi:MAG: hypothetical protein IT290_02950 [Deltaproteobacteria bacterium]|nr:hypothetical protein [Deltaproteobacteria bacterium]
MPVVELVAQCSIIHVITLMILVPGGRLLAERVGATWTPKLRFLSSFGFSSALYGGIFAAGLTVGVPLSALRIVLFAIISVCLAVYLTRGLWRELLEPEACLAFGFTLLYLILATLGSAFPSGAIANVKVDTTMNYTHLPVDNLIPYNVSRFLLEDLPPEATDIVPGWKLTDRGPLAGVLFAVVALLSGSDEANSWLSPSPGRFFFFQAFSTVLNLLSLWSLIYVGRIYFSARAVILALMLLSTTYFFYINVLFSWPKFAMAYFVLTGTALVLHPRAHFVGGVFAGLGMLFHDSALFSFAPLLGAVLLGGAAFPRFARRHPGLCGLRSTVLLMLGFVAVLAPWKVYQKLHPSTDSRLLYEHLFCIKDADLSGRTLRSALDEYLAKNSVTQIVSTKLYNLGYPFNPSGVINGLRAHWPDPVYMARFTSEQAFFQLWWGIGGVTFVLGILGCLGSVRGKLDRDALVYVVPALGALVPPVILFACRGHTVSHIWAYPAFLVIALFAGAAADRMGVWGALLAGVSVGINLVTVALLMFLLPPLTPVLHGSPAYFCTQSVLVGCLGLWSVICLQREGRRKV